MGAGLHSGGMRAPDPAIFVWMMCLLNKKEREKGQNMYLAGDKQGKKKLRKE